VRRDFVEARLYLPKGVEKEDGYDQLGRFHPSAEGVPVGYEKAHEWFRLATETPMPWTTIDLG
jgi:TPR repeat protein